MARRYIWAGNLLTGSPFGTIGLETTDSVSHNGIGADYSKSIRGTSDPGVEFWVRGNSVNPWRGWPDCKKYKQYRLH